MEGRFVIIAYDGVCNLCNALVRFVIKHDNNSVFKFISLQSENFTKYFPSDFPDIKTVLLNADGKTYRKSSAILQIFKHLGGAWKIFLLFYLLPPFFRNFLYWLIAKSRYKVFGRTNQCQIPNKSIANLFLD